MSPRRLLRFDVHKRTGTALTGYEIGEFLQHLEALTHRDAKDFAELHYEFPVVVLPVGRVDSTTPPVTQRDFRQRGAHPRSTHPRTRP